MRYIKLYENYIPKGYLYHGTPDKHNFESSGHITDGTFLSENKHEAYSYGKYLYQVKIKDIPIFDTLDLDNVNLLFKEFGELYDEWADEYITDPMEFRHSSDTWDPIENTDGVLDWVRDNSYRGIRVLEGGTSTILLFYPSTDIISYKLIQP